MTTLTKSKRGFLVITSLLIASCATQSYQAKPLDAQASTALLLAKSPLSADFNAYLIQQGYPAESLPLTSWGLKEMTFCALFYQSRLDVAKAQLGLANAAVETAGVRTPPTLNGSIEHSNRANGDINPWAYGLNVDIPIETSSKRAIKQEEAQQLAEAARMDVAQIAWQLRYQIAADLIHYHHQLALVTLLNKQTANQSDILSMLDKRLVAGLASRTEVNQSQLALLNAQALLTEAQNEVRTAELRLAVDTGLTLANFQRIAITPLALDATLQQQAAILEKPDQLQTLQTSALLNRIDIRKSMAKYAAAETKIRLEVAKQTPDISLNPGFLFDFGDHIWSLGFSSLLNLTKNNTALIKEATQLRTIEGAQFEQLQSQVIAEAQQSYAQFLTLSKSLVQIEAQYQAQSAQFDQLQQQFDAGLVDRLALRLAEQAKDVAQQQLLAAKFQLLSAENEIENTMQAPLYSDFLMPNE